MKDVYLFASGDLRESANRVCWPAQAAMEAGLGAVAAELGARLVRAHPVDPATGHGFLSSQRRGLDAFRGVPPEAPVIVAEAVWQYSHHVLPGLIHHRGPILTIANWSGEWPGLVGLLNLNGSLTKAGVRYSSLWSADFGDAFFRDGLKAWLATGAVAHDLSHVAPLGAVPEAAAAVARGLAAGIKRDKLILGVFDEGCMGMFNAIIPDHLLHPLGVFKERLSQATLYYETMQVPRAEGEAVLAWLEGRGMRFAFGADPETELTRDQVIEQGRMYVAAVRLAERFSCDAIGIQYQQGLKDLLPASDLVEGLLNNAERPPVRGADGGEIRPGQPIVHFNEVDECAGLDALLASQVHAALGEPVETTLHDLRWGDEDRGGDAGFVWVLEISGAAPAAHHVGGYAGSTGYRQPPMYFRLGGSTLAGVARPGDIVWSRLFVAEDRLNLDIGLGEVVALTEAETARRRAATTPEWPIMHARLRGVSRDQMMARHPANHLNVIYAGSLERARTAALCRAELARSLGIAVNLVGSDAWA